MKNKILGYLFVVIAGAVVIAGIYYWQTSGTPQFISGPVHKDETAGWLTYQDAADTFTIKYPQEDRLDPVTVAEGFGTFGNKAQTLVAIAVPKEVFPNTNFQDSYVVVAKSTSIKNAADCKKYSNGSAQLKTLTQSETVNGTTFDTAEYDGVAAGNLYSTKIYRVFHGGSCFEVALTLHTTNIGNYEPTSRVKEVNEGQAWSKLIQVLNTIKFAADYSQDKNTLFCGGLAGIKCPTEGYKCVSEGNFPDAATICTKLQDAGTLKGHVTIGPFCPVQREGMMCPVPANAYASTQIIVTSSDGKTVESKTNLDSQGDYKMDLSAGSYLADYRRDGDIREHSPKPVTISKGQVTTLDFSIDTGIR